MKATAQTRAAQERLAYSVASAARLIPLMSRPELRYPGVRRKATARLPLLPSRARRATGKLDDIRAEGERVRQKSDDFV